MSFRDFGTWKGIALLIVVIFLIVVTLVLRNVFDSQLDALAASHGLLGILLIGLGTNAPFLVPLTGLAIVPIILDIAAQNNKIYVTFWYAVGGTLGESIAYVAGVAGKDIVHLEDSRFYKWLINSRLFIWITNFLLYRLIRKFYGWIRKSNFVDLTLLALVPSPYDLISFAAGRARYPYWLYVLATFLGRSGKYGIIVFFGTEFCEIVGELPIVRFVC